MEKQHQVVVVGGGPAGVTAAIYATRYHLSTLLISPNIGGWVREAPMISNYPGEVGEVNGLELSEKFRKQLVSLNVEMLEDSVIGITRAGKGFTVKTQKGEFEATTVIYAPGSLKRNLNVPGEKEFSGMGVSACVTCDGPFFRGKLVGIAGGGDSAASAALMLKEYAKEVHIFSKDASLIAKPCLTEKLVDDKKVHVHAGTTIKEIVGDRFVTGVKLSDGSEIKLDGVFVEVGMIPNTEMAKILGANLDKEGLVVVDGKMGTNIPGFLAAGDLTTGSDRFRQIVTAAAEGAIAANSAFRYLQEK
jgi:thioredoxin reductase (NADPH)